METFYRTLSVDNMTADLFAPAGIVVRGAVCWNDGNVPFASLVFDTIKSEAVLSVGEKDILPRVVNIRNVPDGVVEGGVEYVFGKDRDLTLSVTRQKEQSFLHVTFTDRKEVIAYVGIRFTKRGATITTWGDPHAVMEKINNQTREVYEHDTGETGAIAFTTVSN